MEGRVVQRRRHVPLTSRYYPEQRPTCYYITLEVSETAMKQLRNGDVLTLERSGAAPSPERSPSPSIL